MTDRNLSNAKETKITAPEFYRTVVRSPEWQAWQKVSHLHGHDATEAVERALISPEHLAAFFGWVRAGGIIPAPKVEEVVEEFVNTFGALPIGEITGQEYTIFDSCPKVGEDEIGLQMVDWLRTTLTTYGDAREAAAREEERERIGREILKHEVVGKDQYGEVYESYVHGCYIRAALTPKEPDNQ